jgi:POT family proton-dependent oligopeptide transporter
MTSIISNAYHNHPEKKNGAYSMYYGVNAGAFLGIMLCGYIGEKFLGVGVLISRRFMLFECYSSILLRTYLEILV